MDISSSGNCDPRAITGQVPSGGGQLAQLLREQGQPELGAALSEFPGFAALVGVHEDILSRLEAALGVSPAQAKHTDPHGVLKLQSLKPGAASIMLRSYRATTAQPASTTTPSANPSANSSANTPASASAITSPTPSPPPPRSAPRVMTQSFSRYLLPSGAARYHTKSGAAAPDHWPTPQLDVELSGDDTHLIMYVGLGPKASLGTDLAYLKRYYSQPPPPPPAAVITAGAGAAAGSAAASASVASPDGGRGDAFVGDAVSGVAAGSGSLPSFMQLEAEARKTEGFDPFVSRSLWVRALAAGALCFTVKWDGGRDPRVMEGIRRYTTTVVDIWLAHLKADAAAVAAEGDAGGGGGGGGLAVDPWDLEQWRRASLVLRNQARHDPMTPMLPPLFGEEQVSKLLETIAGDE